MSRYTSYQPLKEVESSSGTESCHTCHFPPSGYARREKRNATIVSVLLILSNLCTWFLSRQVLYGSSPSKIDPRTPYGMFPIRADTPFHSLNISPQANLERNVPVPFAKGTPYTNPNETLADKLWDDINIDVGMVALPEEFVAAHGLPIAQRFPWDRSKGIYLLNGHHNLHCIVSSPLPPPPPFQILASKAVLNPNPPESTPHLTDRVPARRAPDAGLGPRDALRRRAAARHPLQRRRHSALLDRKRDPGVRRRPGAAVPQLGRARALGPPLQRVFPVRQPDAGEPARGAAVFVLSAGVAVCGGGGEGVWGGAGV